MESFLTSDESCDKDTISLKNQLIGFGLDEENLSKAEMVDLLTALRYSKSSVEEDELLRQQVEENSSMSSPRQTMKRRYIDVRDRRLPWCLLPSNIGQAEKAHVLAVYIKLTSMNNYRQARQKMNFSAWPPPIQIVETSKVQSVRSTRSGRSVPIYAGFDEDSSDFDCGVTKTKRKKVSHSDLSDATYSDKVISLKRKPNKDENMRSIKEAKIAIDSVKIQPETNSVQIDLYIED